MKFSVGWQLFEDDGFINDIISHKEKIHEVYFAPFGFPNGRNSSTVKSGFTPWEALEKQTADLEKLKAAGVRFNLLFNGNCYGEKARSRAFFNDVGDTVDRVMNKYGLSSVTTTSFLVAKFIKSNFEGLDLRASVNVGVSTVFSMEQSAAYFDSYYVGRELNRDFAALKKLRAWCDANGKEMYLLANSGCLNHCAARTFHDNLVSHESAAAAYDNGYDFTGLCGEYFAGGKNRDKFLENTNFIRPEDVYMYEGLVPAVKLATRMNRNPSAVLKAYAGGAFSGSLPSLLEPDHSGAFYPFLLENKKVAGRTADGKLIYSDDGGAFVGLEDIYVDE